MWKNSSFIIIIAVTLLLFFWSHFNFWSGHIILIGFLVTFILMIALINFHHIASLFSVIHQIIWIVFQEHLQSFQCHSCNFINYQVVVNLACFIVIFIDRENYLIIIEYPIHVNWDQIETHVFIDLDLYLVVLSDHYILMVTDNRVMFLDIWFLLWFPNFPWKFVCNLQTRDFFVAVMYYPYITIFSFSFVFLFSPFFYFLRNSKPDLQINHKSMEDVNKDMILRIFKCFMIGQL